MTTLTALTLANRHPVTGVRYTIYHINNDLLPEVWDDIYQGDNLTERAMLDDMELRVRKALEELPDELLPYLNIESVAEELMDTALVNGLNEHIYENDEPRYEGQTDGIRWQLSWLGGAPMLFVLESPYFVVGDLCSPCVPNAVNGVTVTHTFNDLDVAEIHAQTQGGAVGYGLPSTWLRGEEL